MHNSTSCHFPLGEDRPRTTPSQDSPVALWLHRAQQVIANEGLREPEERRLSLIVEAALEVRSLYFAAALHDPTPEDLYSYFEEFIVRSIGGEAETLEYLQ